VKLLVATRNQGKLREIRRLLGPHGLEVVGLSDLPAAPDVDESGETFLENARLKAWTIAEATGLPTLADDSGLAVDALGGRPGVRSARYAGPQATDGDNNRLLLAELQGVPEPDRTAAFLCSMVLAVPGHGEHTSEGRLRGRILGEPRGQGGFGFDPLFLVEGTNLTLAELEPAEKNQLSHRGRALRDLLPQILSLKDR
jgi:XTP/dITP diphosphohydrolase